VAPAGELHPPTPAELAELLGTVAAHDPQLHDFVVLAAVTSARRANSSGCGGATSIYLGAGCVVRQLGRRSGRAVLFGAKTKRRRAVDVGPARRHPGEHHGNAGEDADVADGFGFSDDHGITPGGRSG
jgi:hypothetical protein